MSPEQAEQQTVEEITPQEAFTELDAGGVKLIDTREPYEYEESHIDGSELIPPGVIADRIAVAAPDKSQRIILQCRSGVRSLDAGQVLQELGYEDVASMAGGILEWEAQGLPVESNVNLTPAQRDRYSRHILLPEVGVEGQIKMLEAKVLLLGRRPWSADRSLPRCGGDRHDRHRRRRCGRCLQPAASGDSQHQPGRHPEVKLGPSDDRGAEP